jgi:hypothetical protein
VIIAASIVDAHKPKGEMHVGLYLFEIPYSGDSHFDLVALATPPGDEDKARPHLGKLLSKEDLLRIWPGGVVNLFGEAVVA